METRRCSKCGERKPISGFHKKGLNKQGIQQYSVHCRQCRAEYIAEYYKARKDKLPSRRRKLKEFTDADEERIFSANRGVVSMKVSAELANEAFPLLSNQYWKAGEAQKIYKQLGMKWSYL